MSRNILMGLGILFTGLAQNPMEFAVIPITGEPDSPLPKVYERSISPALSKARKSKKPLWIVASATWCGPCKIVEKYVLSDKRFIEAVQKDFIPLYFYAESGPQTTPGADQFIQKYSIRGYPTFLMMDADGHVFFRLAGLPAAVPHKDSLHQREAFVQAFLSLLQEGLELRRRLPEMHKRFAQGERNREFLLDYLHGVLHERNPESVRQTFDAYIKASENPRIAWLGSPRALEALERLVEFDTAYQRYALSIASEIYDVSVLPSYIAIFKPLLWEDFSKRYLTWQERLDSLEKYMRWRIETVPLADLMLYDNIWSESIAPPFLGGIPEEEKSRLKPVFLQYGRALIGSDYMKVSEEKTVALDRLNTLAATLLKETSPMEQSELAAWMRYATEISPEDPRLWATLAEIYAELGYWAYARKALAKAESFPGASPNTLMRLRQRLNDTR